MIFSFPPNRSLYLKKSNKLSLNIQSNVMIETKKHQSISKSNLTSPLSECQKFLELRRRSLIFTDLLWGLRLKCLTDPRLANCKHGADLIITNSKVDPSQQPCNDLQFMVDIKWQIQSHSTESQGPGLFQKFLGIEIQQQHSQIKEPCEGSTNLPGPLFSRSPPVIFLRVTSLNHIQRN